MDCCNLKFRSNYFDVYLAMFNVFDEIFPIEKRIKAIKEAFRVLKRGGLLITSSHNLVSTLIRPRKLLKWFIFYKSKHYVKVRKSNKLYYCSTIKETLKQFEAVGFKLVEIYPNSLFEPFPYYVFRK